MKHVIRTVALASALLGGLSGCANGPTLESIRYGYNPQRVAAEKEAVTASEANNMASGWMPERANGEAPPTLGRDGTPVVASSPGAVTTTTRPLNDGVSREPMTPDGGGSRGLLLDLYVEAVDSVEQLTQANGDLSAALEMSEARSREFEAQLAALQQAYDELGTGKQDADQKNFDLAGRLATAQIARLEAERALLEATIEWRRMSAENNAPLTANQNGGAASQRPTEDRQ